MSMLGSRGADNTLTGLVGMVSDPDKFKASLAQLKAASENHRAERDAAAKQKRDAEEVIAKANERLAFLEQREKDVKADQDQIAAAKQALQTDRARHEAQVAAFNDSKEKTVRAHQARVAAERKDIADAEAALKGEKERQDVVLGKIIMELKDKEARLDDAAKRQSRMQADLERRAVALTDLEQDVRGRIKKINELFPVT